MRVHELMAGVLSVSWLWGCNVNKGMVPSLKFGHNAKQVESLCTSGQEQLSQLIETIALTPLEKVTFETSAKALEKALTDFNNSLGSVLFLKYVAIDKEVRAVADACENKVQHFLVDLFTREDLYRILKAAKAKLEPLAPVDALLLDEYLIQFKRNGLELSAEQRKLYSEKKKRLVLIESEFAKNLVEEKTSVDLTQDELEGLPKLYLEELKKLDNGKYHVNLDYPHYFPFMENAKNGEARRRVELEFNNRGGAKNKALLDEAIQLRRELALMLGYANHAAYVLDRRMAQTPKKVFEFLEQLGKRMGPIGKKFLAELLELKREELQDPTAKEISSWDWRYYRNLLKKKKYNVDPQVIKEYFPVETVMRGMFEIYQKLLGVKFVKQVGVSVWHPNVELYSIMEGEKVIANFYMDLFPREGKYNHAAAFTLTNGHTLADGTYFAPSSAIVANFNPPSQDKPALLEHSEVETLFHEFGHIMHQTLTRAKYATFSGTNVKTDFVEAPSQMLENWVWRKETLVSLSGHYRTPAKPLPDDMIERLVGAKRADAGIHYLRQLAFANIDMIYHTAENVDSTEVYKKAMKEIMLVPIQEGSNPHASFGHLMGGYDAGYYGYLWSEVYAQDMFTRFEKEGFSNPKTGMDYRKWILEPGSEKQPFDLIKGFLGREPNEEAFLKSIGLAAEQ